MTVRELVAALNDIDQTRLVVLSADEEGNCYQLLQGMESSLYSAKEGEVGPERLTPDLVRQGFTEEDVMSDGVPAVVFYP